MNKTDTAEYIDVSEITIEGLKGEDGKDAPAVDIDKIIKDVLAQIPVPKDGKDAVIDYEKVVKEVLSRIPRPVDGKDAVVDYEHVVREAVAKIPKAKDGVDGKDGSPDSPDEVVEKVNISSKKIKAKQVEGLNILQQTVDSIASNPVGYASGGANQMVIKNSGTRVSDHITELDFSTGLSAVYSNNGKVTITGSSATGDVVGPSSSTDNAIARYDGATGKLIQNSSVTIDDSNNLTTTGTTTTGLLGVTGTSVTISPPSSVTASITYQAGLTLPNDGYNYTFRVYSYRLLDDERIYSSTYTQSNTVTDNGLGGQTYYVTCTWPAVTGAAGYVVLIQDTVIGYTYDTYIDTTLTTGHFYKNEPPVDSADWQDDFATNQFGVPSFTPSTDYSNTTVHNGNFTVNGKLDVDKRRGVYFDGTLGLKVTDDTLGVGRAMTAVGIGAGDSFTGLNNQNTLIGYNAGTSLTSGTANTFIGHKAGSAATTALNNIVFGANGGEALTTGVNNFFAGSAAGQSTTTGSNNVGIGLSALQNNILSDDNVAVGSYALRKTTATGNTALGKYAGPGNTTGTGNTYLGFKAGYNNENVQTLSNVTLIGANTEVTASNSVIIGKDAKVGINSAVNTAPTAWLHVPASTTAAASIRIPSGTAPTSPNSGDLWYDGTNLKFRDGSTTRTINWT